MAHQRHPSRAAGWAADRPPDGKEPGSGNSPSPGPHSRRPGTEPPEDSASAAGPGSPAPATDGHWPFARPVPAAGPGTFICCECGEAPARRPARASMQHAWHQAHRRKLGLQPVEYAWPDAMTGLSTGGYMQVRGAAWRGGRWAPE